MNPFTIIVLFIFGLLIGYRADRLGRNFLIWMICAMIFTPILTWIALEISGKTDEKKAEENKNLILKNEPDEEPDTEVVTPSGNVFQFVSRKEGDIEESSPPLESVEKLCSYNEEEEPELNSADENLNLTNESQEHLTVDEKISKTDVVITPKAKWFNKKMFTVPLNQIQKIIYSISSFLIVLVLAYVIAEEVDYELQISHTWGVWIIFILIQAWLQSKLWNSGEAVNFAFYYPNVSTLFSSIKSPNSSQNVKVTKVTKPLVIEPVQEKPILVTKQNRDSTGLLIYGLVGLMFVLVIVAVIMKKDNHVETTKIVPSSDLPFVAPENEVIQSSEANTTDVNEPVSFDNETVSKLFKELQDGRVKTYDFKDPSSLGFKFKSTFPESLKFFVKKTAECKAGAELLDAHGNTLKYTIVLNEGPIPYLSSSQLDEALDATPNTQIEAIYKSISKSYEILNSGTKMFIGNYRAICFDLLMDNIAESEIKYSAVRSYNFYFKGGIGQLSFWLHNNNRSQLKKDFLEYETLFQEIANRSTLNKEQ